MAPGRLEMVMSPILDNKHTVVTFGLRALRFAARGKAPEEYSGGAGAFRLSARSGWRSGPRITQFWKCQTLRGMAMLPYRAGHFHPCRTRSRHRRACGRGIVCGFGGRRVVYKRMRLLISLTSAGQIVSVRASTYFVIIDRALRDEGTSYHYMPASEFADADPQLVQAASIATSKTRPRVIVGSTWTMDAPFRETAEAIEAARTKGILGSRWKRRRSMPLHAQPACDFFVSPTSPIPWVRTAPTSRRAKPTAPETPFRCWVASSRHCLRPVDPARVASSSRWSTGARSAKPASLSFTPLIPAMAISGWRGGPGRDSRRAKASPGRT